MFQLCRCVLTLSQLAALMRSWQPNSPLVNKMRSGKSPCAKAVVTCKIKKMLHSCFILHFTMVYFHNVRLLLKCFARFVQHFYFTCNHCLKQECVRPRSPTPYATLPAMIRSQNVQHWPTNGFCCTTKYPYTIMFSCINLKVWILCYFL